MSWGRYLPTAENSKGSHSAPPWVMKAVAEKQSYNNRGLGSGGGRGRGYREEEPLLEGPVLGLQDTAFQLLEALQHPSLLWVCQVLNG